MYILTRISSNVLESEIYLFSLGKPYTDVRSGHPFLRETIFLQLEILDFYTYIDGLQTLHVMYSRPNV